MEEIIKGKYKIIKTIESDESNSLYIVEEINTGKNYALRKVYSTITKTLYEVALTEFEKIKNNPSGIDKHPFAPKIVDIFRDDMNNYLLMEYERETHLKMISYYPSLGKILNNRYVVIKGIATGGFGIVYLVRDLSLPNKYWALKEMHDESGLPEVMEKSFRVEAEMLSSLEHTAIPGISDFFIDEQRLYLVMDYVQGETIKNKLKTLKEGEFFPEEQVIKWALSLCDVLNYLHKRPVPIVFRDLKPDNLMVNNEGEIKLIDFGIARVFQGPKKETTQFALLTEGYAPREQWYGRAEPRSDIYSLGATLFHILTNVHPKKVTPAFPSPEKYNPAVSPDLGKIIIKALSPDLKDRYQSIIEMQADLSKISTRQYRKEKASFHYSRGEKFEGDKDYFNANFEYMKALEYDEENLAILTGVARCCEKLGFFDKGLYYYDKIEKLDITPERRTEIKSKVIELSKKISSETAVKKEEPVRKTSVKEGEIEQKIPANAWVPEKIKSDQDEKSHYEVPHSKIETVSSQAVKTDLWSRILAGSLLVVIPLSLVFILILTAGAIWIYYPDIFSPVNKKEGEKCYKEGMTLYENGKYKEAIPYFNKATEFDPEHIYAYNSMGLCYYNLNKYDEAIRAYDKALNLAPEDAVIWYNRGRVYQDIENYDEAITCYDRALKFNPSDIYSLEQKGLTFYAQGKYSDAIDCYNIALNIDIKNGNIWNDKGNVFFSMNNFDRAIDCYNEALKLKPDEFIFWYNKGQSLYNLDEYKEAIKYFDIAIEKNPGYMDAWNDKGNALFSLEEFKEALKCYDEALKLKPEDEVLWANKGGALLNLKRYEEALSLYDKGLTYFPSSSLLWSRKGDLLYEQKKFQEALECYEGVLKIDPLDRISWNNKGLCLYELGRYEEAIICYDEALKIAPEYVEPYNNKKKALEKLKK